MASFLKSLLLAFTLTGCLQASDSLRPGSLAAIKSISDKLCDDIDEETLPNGLANMTIPVEITELPAGLGFTGDRLEYLESSWKFLIGQSIFGVLHTYYRESGQGHYQNSEQDTPHSEDLAKAIVSKLSRFISESNYADTDRKKDLQTLHKKLSSDNRLTSILGNYGAEIWTRLDYMRGEVLGR